MQEFLCETSPQQLSTSDLIPFLGVVIDQQTGVVKHPLPVAYLSVHQETASLLVRRRNNLGLVGLVRRTSHKRDATWEADLRAKQAMMAGNVLVGGRHLGHVLLSVLPGLELCATTRHLGRANSIHNVCRNVQP